MGSGPNPATMNSRKGRLAVFVRGKSDAEARYNASTAKNEVPQPRTDTHLAAPAFAPPPTKEELAEEARLPIAEPFVSAPAHQPAASGPKQILHPSPQIPIPENLGQPPGKQNWQPPPQLAPPEDADEDTRRTLFEGSQLGENFMDSGLTTPRNEPTDRALTPFEERIPENHAEKDRGGGNGHGQFNRPVVSRGPYSQMNENGLMSVNSGLGRRSPSHVRDGFHIGAIQERGGHRQSQYHRSTSPAGHTKNMPIREVKVPRPGAPARGNYATGEGLENRPPDRDNQRWPTRHKGGPWDSSMVIELDDDDNLQADQDVPNKTPKPHRSHRGHHKVLMGNSMPPTMDVPDRFHNKKRSRASPDYDDMALSSMSYKELQKEPFDLDPGKEAMQNHHSGDADPLANKLNQVRHQTEKEQQHFFATMPIKEWEQSGEWFVDQFGDIMKKLKNARRDKRQMIDQFENEASNREEKIRLRTEAVDRKLVKMKQDGQRVVGDGVF